MRAELASELYAAASGGFYANAIMVAAYYGFVALVLALAFYLDTRRAFAFKNKPSEICLANEKHRWALYYALVIALLAGYIMQSGGFGSSGFGMYAGFCHDCPDRLSTRPMSKWAKRLSPKIKFVPGSCWYARTRATGWLDVAEAFSPK